MSNSTRNIKWLYKINKKIFYGPNTRQNFFDSLEHLDKNLKKIENTVDQVPSFFVDNSFIYKKWTESGQRIVYIQ